MAPAASRVALCIMAKAPVAGQVKTRLCPPLSAGDAAELSRCFLVDKIAQVRQVTRAEPIVAYAPEGAAAVFESLAPG
ncbi:MAG TPA: glycosyltransferase, partial [Methylomirabilota bacterium]